MDHVSGLLDEAVSVGYLGVTVVDAQGELHSKQITKREQRIKALTPNPRSVSLSPPESEFKSTEETRVGIPVSKEYATK